MSNVSNSRLSDWSGGRYSCVKKTLGQIFKYSVALRRQNVFVFKLHLLQNCCSYSCGAAARGCLYSFKARLCFRYRRDRTEHALCDQKGSYKNLHVRVTIFISQPSCKGGCDKYKTSHGDTVIPHDKLNKRVGKNIVGLK